LHAKCKKTCFIVDTGVYIMPAIQQTCASVVALWCVEDLVTKPFYRQLKVQQATQSHCRLLWWIWN